MKAEKIELKVNFRLRRRAKPLWLLWFFQVWLGYQPYVPKWAIECKVAQ